MKRHPILTITTIMGTPMLVGDIIMAVDLTPAVVITVEALTAAVVSVAVIIDPAVSERRLRSFFLFHIGEIRAIWG